MGFLQGRLTCSRFHVSGKKPRAFGQQDLDFLDANAIGKQRVAAADGSQFGWIAADHILDTTFDLAKNVVNDAMHFAFRIDAHAIPADLLRAYTQVELAGLAAGNPSGIPSARQKREARLLAKERLETEAKDGRFLKRKSVPVLWDCLSNELLIGTTSATAIDRVVNLFRQTFNRNLDLITAGCRANSQDAGNTDNAAPSFGDLAWLPDESNRDFLGNEFALWLWYVLEKESDAIRLADNSEATVMMARTLALECPRGQTGKDSITSEGPGRLPESHRAIQAGKLPRKIGLTVVRHDQMYELSLQAETLAITGAKLPAAEESGRAGLEERVTKIRALLETLDLLFTAFCSRRLGSRWIDELGSMKEWLKEAA